MDFLKAVNIIGRDLEEAMALLEQLSGLSGSNLVDTELARLRVMSASEIVKLLPELSSAEEVKRYDESTKRVNSASAAPPEESGQPAAVPPVAATETESINHTVTAVEQTPNARSQEAVELTLKAGSPEAVEQPPKAGSPEAVEQTPKAGSPEVVEQTPKAGSPEVVEQPPKARSQEAAKPILADRFASSERLAEKISHPRQDDDLSSKIKSKPITDIGDAIGMNDKFYFIRELFSGDVPAYNDTIRRLNAAISLGEAMKILDESTVMDSDPAAQSSFVDVVRRKFSLNV